MMNNSSPFLKENNSSSTVLRQFYLCIVSFTYTRPKYSVNVTLDHNIFYLGLFFEIYFFGKTNIKHLFNGFFTGFIQLFMHVNYFIININNIYFSYFTAVRYLFLTEIISIFFILIFFHIISIFFGSDFISSNI